MVLVGHDVYESDADRRRQAEFFRSLSCCSVVCFDQIPVVIVVLSLAIN